LEENKDYY
jgi:hypothetical protein